MEPPRRRRRIFVDPVKVPIPIEDRFYAEKEKLTFHYGFTPCKHLYIKHLYILYIL